MIAKRVSKQPHGFTLIELAIVVAIVALLLSMLVVPLGTQFEQQRIAETQRQLAATREAILGFAITNGRLPCPADPTLPTGTPNAGIENRTATGCTAAQGVLPWLALGVPQTDAWGRRFTYRVDPAFADDPPAGMQSSFLVTDNGNIAVRDRASNIATTLPAIAISHGKNGLGAYQPDGTQLAGAAGDELENANNNLIFVSRPHAPDFDDQLTWISAHVLKSRMVAAYRLP